MFFKVDITSPENSVLMFFTLAPPCPTHVRIITGSRQPTLHLMTLQKRTELKLIMTSASLSAQEICSALTVIQQNTLFHFAFI